MPAESGNEVLTEEPIIAIDLNSKPPRRGSFAVCESGQIYNVPDLLTADSFQSLLNEINTFIFDADGNFFFLFKFT